MNNQKLVTCLECGHEISRNADLCPKCKTRHYMCFFCKKSILPDEKDFILSGRYVHESCFSPYFKLSNNVVCQTCSKPLNNKSFELELVISISPCSCPHCAEPLPFGEHNSCIICHRQIIPAIHRSVKKDSYDFHDFCFKVLHDEPIQ